MKPTVSDSTAFEPPGRDTALMVGSSVANSVSSAKYLGPGQRVEQGRLAGIGVADQRHRRVGHALARFAMQAARTAHLLELLADDVDALADDAAVGLDLRLAGTAEKTEAAALPLKVGPGPDQPALLIDEMGELDLQAPFPRPRPLAEDLEDQPGAIEHLGVPCPFEVALLHGCERVIDDDQRSILGAHQSCKLFDLAGAEQRRRPWARHRHEAARGDVEIDRGSETRRLFEPGLRRPLRFS